MWEHNGNPQVNSTVADRGHTASLGLESVHSIYKGETRTSGVDLKSHGQNSEPLLYRIGLSAILLILSLEWIYPVTSTGQIGRAHV